MTTIADIRTRIVNLARADNGLDVGQRGTNGDFYPGPVNRYNRWCMGTGAYAVYACAQGVSTWFGDAGWPIPTRSPGRGIWYVPYLLDEGRKRGAVLGGSWLSQPADIVIFGWTPNSTGDHTGVVVAYDREHGILYTMEADSGPGVKPYDKEGGTKLHAWSCPFGVGNDLIMAVLDASKMSTATLTAEPAPTPTEDEDDMSPELTAALNGVSAGMTTIEAALERQDAVIAALSGRVDRLGGGGQLLRCNGPVDPMVPENSHGEGPDADGNPGRAFAIWDVAFTTLPDGTVVGTKFPVHPGFENIGAGNEVPPPVRPVTAAFLALLKTWSVTPTVVSSPSGTVDAGHPVSSASGSTITGRPVSSAAGQ